jgi:hypothetical protein
MTNPISLKLAWADGSAEIACEAGQFETAVAAAERLLGIAVSRAAPPTGGPRASAAAPSAGESSNGVAGQRQNMRPRRTTANPATSRTDSKPKLGAWQYKDFSDFKWDIGDENEVKLYNLYQAKMPKGQQQSVAVILYCFREICNKSTVTYDEIYKAWRLVDKSVPPKSLGGVVSNMALASLVAREEGGIRLKAFGDELVKGLPRAPAS